MLPSAYSKNSYTLIGITYRNIVSYLYTRHAREVGRFTARLSPKSMLSRMNVRKKWGGGLRLCQYC